MACFHNSMVSGNRFKNLFVSSFHITPSAQATGQPWLTEHFSLLGLCASSLHLFVAFFIGLRPWPEGVEPTGCNAKLTLANRNKTRRKLYSLVVGSSAYITTFYIYIYTHTHRHTQWDLIFAQLNGTCREGNTRTVECHAPGFVHREINRSGLSGKLPLHTHTHKGTRPAPLWVVVA